MKEFMPTVQAHVATDRASRYLAQLCSHLHHMETMSHHSPVSHAGDHGESRHHGGDHDGSPTRPMVEHVDRSDSYGSIRFTGGLCTLRATADALTLRIDADDEHTLQRLQDGLAGRLRKIGRRDRLTVTWHRTESSPPADGRSAEAEAASRPAVGQRRSRLITVGLVALGALIVLVHTVLGGVLAVSVLEQWGVGVLVALVVVKVLIGGLHVVGGGFALRKGRVLRPRGKALLGHGQGLPARWAKRSSVANPTPEPTPAPSEPKPQPH